MWSTDDICPTAPKSNLRTRLWLAADWYDFDPIDGESAVEAAKRAKDQGLTKMHEILIKADELDVSF